MEIEDILKKAKETLQNFDKVSPSEYLAAINNSYEAGRKHYIKTLRDEFALEILKERIKSPNFSNMRDQVFDAYHYADIMLAVRSGKDEFSLEG